MPSSARLLNGEGVRPDDAEAARWFARGAALGFLMFAASAGQFEAATRDLIAAETWPTR